MLFRTVQAIFTLLGLHIIGVLTSPIDTPEADNELVHTPIGLMPKSNVHLVPKGAHIHHTPTQVQLIGVDGTILHSEEISQMASTTTPRFPVTPVQANTPRALQTGSVCYAVWTDDSLSSISSYTATMDVPNPPSNFDGQVFFLFSGLQPDGSTVLESALQFGVTGAGGGNFYAVASWFITGTTVFHSQATEIGAIGAIKTDIGLTSSSSAPPFTWGIGFTGFDNSGLVVTTSDKLIFAFQGLQINFASSVRDLSIGPMDIVEIAIETPGTPQELLEWTIVDDQIDGITIAVASNSATNGILQLTIP